MLKTHLFLHILWMCLYYSYSTKQTKFASFTNKKINKYLHTYPWRNLLTMYLYECTIQYVFNNSWKICMRKMTKTMIIKSLRKTGKFSAHNVILQIIHWAILKGQSHEIFAPGFFHQSAHFGLIKDFLEPFRFLCVFIELLDF